MHLETTRFGALTLDEANILTFPDGLPGFEECHRFTFVPHHLASGDKCSPFEWLQSLDDGALAFLAIDPRHVFSAYAPHLPPNELAALELNSASPGQRLYALLTIPPGDPCGITANLLAPIVVNPAAQLAKQVVAHGDEYSLRHRLLPEPMA